MSDDNQITVRGRVGTQPDLNVTPSGREVTNFRLGSTRRIRDGSGEWRDADTEWFTVKAWGAMAAAVLRSVNKGMPVIVQGTFRCEEWLSGDQQRRTNVITATSVGVDIRHGIVRHHKLAKQAPVAATGTGGPVPSAATATATAADGEPPADGAVAFATEPSPEDEEDLADELGLHDVEDPWATTATHANGSTPTT